MSRTEVIAVFDIGKTNKKCFLFDQAYRIVYERSSRFEEITDEDGDPCEDLGKLQQAFRNLLNEVLAEEKYHVKAVNFATYGASLVYIDADGIPLTPLYNYLKAYPVALKQQFYQAYGGEEAVSLVTASPVLGSLNSGMQLYRLKYEKPALFAQVKYVLHLPQYMSLLLTGRPCADITSIGCHTQLWDYTRNRYHAWVEAEGLLEKLPELLPCDTVIPAAFEGHSLLAGTGLHDSSSALIPYLVSMDTPFALLSTGTWCITLNPFNAQPLTAEELHQDCLSYMTYQGHPVKASRLFAGHEHEQQANRIAVHFRENVTGFHTVAPDPRIIEKQRGLPRPAGRYYEDGLRTSVFGQRDLSQYASYDEAYHQLIVDLVLSQAEASLLVMEGAPVKKIFVDGGFGKNALFMHLLAAALPQYEVYAASVAQATALGAALAIHAYWNAQPLRKDLVELKHYPALPEWRID